MAKLLFCPASWHSQNKRNRLNEQQSKQIAKFQNTGKGSHSKVQLIKLFMPLLRGVINNALELKLEMIRLNGPSVPLLFSSVVFKTSFY